MTFWQFANNHFLGIAIVAIAMGILASIAFETWITSRDRSR